ncbi:hypothetical protein BT96DRAFT_947994 [Gymnopus androsaceus JB14]|uniref:Uncharacterized protein n=1 Tax=Gymnopus androsaceus JB14 TaxID=1447944 RepID=A0A6A4GQ39_9AGAR|nr:hypothetical protein BT96DRAFT_947994 [Gymnopus androsaceus JB14]
MLLYLHISTLLAIGNASNCRAENVNAVIGETTMTAGKIAMEFLHVGKARDIRQPLRGNPPQGRNDKGMDSPTESLEIGGENKEDSSNGAERPVIPNAVHGKELLEEWLPGATIGASTLANDFTFGEHLQDLFNVIVSLMPSSSVDLMSFQLFIHHRAYRKLGWRVLDFLTHWGKSPFGIIYKCLADPSLVMESIDLKIDPGSNLHEFIQDRITLQLSPETNSEPVYCVNSDNALQWLCVLHVIWSQLQKKLLVTQSQGKPKVRKELPTPQEVVTIDEAEDSPYHSRTLNSSGDKSHKPDTDGGDGDESVEPDTDGGDDLESMVDQEDHESCHLFLGLRLPAKFCRPSSACCENCPGLANLLQVHAEAALMDWIVTVKDIPPSTHGIFCAWLPPPGIPDDILLELCVALLAACKAFVPGHSRHSSASSTASDATPDNLPIYLGPCAFGDFLRSESVVELELL